MDRPPRVSCDSVASVDPVAGTTVFAKNSDRPARECQPLAFHEARDHRPGSRLACQYIEIEQAGHSHALTGSRPWWLWGLEQGVNECGVAIGNHTVFAREPAADTGLTGMDLVRLGLERGASAAQAVEVITGLIERHGQGGSGHVDVVWPYNNSFIVADSTEVYLLEAVGRYWAFKGSRDRLSTSNRLVINTDWDALSAGCRDHAGDKGWHAGAPFDFAAAYADPDAVPEVISSGRYRTTQTALGRQGALSVAAAMRLMRDHYDGGPDYLRREDPAVEIYYSLCMHADPVGTTTASMITELGAQRPLLVWVALGNPCASVYTPVVVGVRPPEELLTGGREPGPSSAWWRFRTLVEALEADPVRLAPLLREHWRAVEEKLARLAAAVDRDSARAFMEEAWRLVSGKLGEALRLARA